MIAVCPSDNMGLRDFCICSGLKLGKYREILKLCELFQSPSFEEEDEEDEQEELVDEYYCSDSDRETTDPTVMNGRIIALWRSLSSQSPLNYWLEIAIKRSPLVAEILLLDKPLPPLDSNLESYTSGGADEAYLYWQRFGEFWRDRSILLWKVP